MPYITETEYSNLQLTLLQNERRIKQFEKAVKNLKAKLQAFEGNEQQYKDFKRCSD